MLLRNPLQRNSINPCSYFTIPGLDLDKYHFRESKQANIKLARNPGKSSPLTFSTYIFEIIHKYQSEPFKVALTIITTVVTSFLLQHRFLSAADNTAGLIGVQFGH